MLEYFALFAFNQALRIDFRPVFAILPVHEDDIWF